MIFQEFQNNPNVDMAIPYIYSSKAGAERKEADASKHKSMPHIQDIDMSHIQEPDLKVDYAELEPIIESISTQGLLQPILLNRNPIKGTYEILAGHLRYEACKRLGWRTIPAIIQGEKSDIRDSKEH
jgi:ParB/RepB/Spo0J family partition protein